MWNFTQPRNNEILSFASKWMELENIILSSYPGSEGQKSCSPSYGDYRPKTNTVILLDMGHMLRGEHAQEK
jgi:hypothetical protein